MNFPESGDGTAEINVNEIELESFLTRLRQFYMPGELFYAKDLYRSVVAEYGNSETFQRFYDQLWSVNNKRFPNANFYKSDGSDVVGGLKFRHLIEQKLYVGALHSDSTVNPNAPAHLRGLIDAHKAVAARLSLDAAYGSLRAASNIFAFRYHILLLAREAERVDTVGMLALHNGCIGAEC